MSKRSKTKAPSKRPKERVKNIIVFTDGSCIGNGKEQAIGGIGIHFPKKELKDISKVYRDGFCTNQRTELYAILTALRYIKKNLGLSQYKVHIKTDSNYSINCVTKWIGKWKKNGWKTTNGDDVSNKEYIELIDKYNERYDITYAHVAAHTGKSDANSRANAKADELALAASKRAQSEVSRGSCLNKSRSKRSTSKRSGNQNPRLKSKYLSKSNKSGDDIIVELVKS